MPEIRTAAPIQPQSKDYRWLIRFTIAQRIPLPLRKWIMSRYYWARLQLDKAIDLAQLSINGYGEKPRIYFPRYLTRRHNAWRIYADDPPLRFTSYPLAELCHWVNYVPDRPTKPCITECEHILALAGDITNWQQGLQNLDVINRLVAQDNCRFVMTYSNGLMQHSRRYLQLELWPKFGYIYPSFPRQAEYQQPPDRPFTIFTIASRFSDKGVPEALRAFQILRDRHGEDVRMILVSQAVPAGYRLPNGVIHYNTPRMSLNLKAQLFQAAHVLFIPCYSDSGMPLIEACAFGVPIVFTRIHFSEEAVQDGVTGYLIDTPVYSYSEHYGTRWKLWEDFLADLDAMRERGEFQTVVDQSVDRLEAMFNDRTRLTAMGRAARALHAERFSPEVRNHRLLRLYDAALKSETQFPE